ncbi:MAG: hypothetical protein JST42_11480 [Bacteroidetes bacterium]|nr:hypothetical protein [Bacteroidota bacterium]
MKKFLRQTTSILGPVVLLMAGGIFLPSTPHAGKSLLFGSLAKDSLLRYVDSPRIILVGGSNLSFGIDSRMIRDSLRLNPINTGITASLGLKFMLDNTLGYVKKGDIIVLVPEYPLLTEDYNYGSEELLRTILEVNPGKWQLLNMAQALRLLPFLPKYALSKYVPTEYLRSREDPVYGIHSFNSYGDTYTHWNLPRRLVRAEKKTDSGINDAAIDGIVRFRDSVERRKAIFLISYCCLQDISYHRMEPLIKKIEKVYLDKGFHVLGSPERYMMPDSLTFNTPYHLNKSGADYRTALLINDVRRWMLAMGPGRSLLAYRE